MKSLQVLFKYFLIESNEQMNQELEKENAAIAALEYVKEGMILGLGTGSTTAYLIKHLGEKIQNGLNIKGIPTSEQTKILAKNAGIPLVELSEVSQIDLTIDGADEFDPYLQLIKGGGGALLREKIVAENSKMNLIIADSKKRVERLGKFPLPIETIPFATEKIIKQLEKWGLNATIRIKDQTKFVTDEGNYIVDVDISKKNNLSELNIDLKNIAGVVETGLFLNTTHKIIMGIGNSIVEYT